MLKLGTQNISALYVGEQKIGSVYLGGDLVFDPVPVYTVNVSVDPAGSGAVFGAGSYREGQTVTITAEPESGYQFVAWQENGEIVSEDEIYTFAVDRDRALTAVFAVVPQYVAGRDWWETTLPTSRNWNAIAYGNGVFIAVSIGGNMCGYSPDSIHWTENALPSSANRYSIAFGSGKFVTPVYGQYGVNYSTDGITWEVASTVSGATAQRCAAYGNDRFVVLSANGSSNSQKAAYSTTGASWSAATAPTTITASFYALAYGNGRFVTIYNGNLYYSTSGSGWTKGTVPNASYCYSIVWGGDKFVATQYNSNVALYSYDGITWEKATLPSTGYWYGVTYGDGRFVMVAANNTDKVLYSDDGINWEESTLPSAANWRAVTYGDGSFVAVAYGSDKVAYSNENGPDA